MITIIDSDERRRRAIMRNLAVLGGIARIGEATVVEQVDLSNVNAVIVVATDDTASCIEQAARLRRHGCQHVIILAWGDHNDNHDNILHLPPVERWSACEVEHLVRTCSHSSTTTGGLIAVAASAGGPAAIVELLGDLAADLATPILIAQHIAEDFSASFTDWIKNNFNCPIHVIDHPRPLCTGAIHLAGPGRHLILNEGGIIDAPHRHNANEVCPNIDRFFTSIADHHHGPVTAVYLTGMGNDGVSGLQQLRERDAYILVQDGASAAVDGMPRAAREAGLADFIGPPSELATALRPLACRF
ncbi:MAG: chemotaxis protein CheB [Planctomycetota bacterium]